MNALDWDIAVHSARYWALMRRLMIALTNYTGDREALHVRWAAWVRRSGLWDAAYNERAAA
jgi:hypothetical protein